MTEKIYESGLSTDVLKSIQAEKLTSLTGTIEDINELIIGVRSGDDGRGVYVAQITGTVAGINFWNAEYVFNGWSGGSLYSVTTGDLDGDGLLEIHAVMWNMMSVSDSSFFMIVSFVFYFIYRNCHTYQLCFLVPSSFAKASADRSTRQNAPRSG